MQLRSGTTYTPPMRGNDIFTTSSTKIELAQSILKIKPYLNVIIYLDEKLLNDKGMSLGHKNVLINTKLSVIIDLWKFLLTDEAKMVVKHCHKFTKIIRQKCDSIEQELKCQADATLSRAVLVAEFNHCNTTLKQFIDGLA